MRTSDVDILIVPGSGNLDPDHWQARWQAKLSTARLVMPIAGVDTPLEDWLKGLAHVLEGVQRPVLFVGHGLGAAAIVHSAAQFGTGVVRGAFLVAPPSERGMETMTGIDPAFLTYPRDPLPFPSVVVASRSHPSTAYDEIEDLAFAWGSMILDAGEAGGIDHQSGHGPWPEGLMSFAGFLKKL